MFRQIRAILGGHIWAVVLLAFGAATGWAHLKGIERGRDRCQAAHEEAARLVNDALRAANRRAEEAARQYLAQEAELSQLEKELSRARLADPDFGRECLGPNGVSRINEIR